MEKKAESDGDNLSSNTVAVYRYVSDVARGNQQSAGEACVALNEAASTNAPARTRKARRPWRIDMEEYKAFMKDWNKTDTFPPRPPRQPEKRVYHRDHKPELNVDEYNAFITQSRSMLLKEPPTLPWVRPRPVYKEKVEKEGPHDPDLRPSPNRNHNEAPAKLQNQS